MYTDPLGLNPFGGGNTRNPGIPGPPTDVFFPGTPANNAFVESVYRVGQAIKDFCTDDDDECEKEWREARRICRELIYEQMEQAAGRRKKRSVTGVTGGYTDVEQCARGLVSKRCGGNALER